jgi:hypothetical protein
MFKVAKPHPSVGRPSPSPEECGAFGHFFLPSPRERGWGDRRSGEVFNDLRH